MDLLDFILNLAGLLLWFGWRQTRARLVVPSAGISLLSTLRRTDAGEHRTHLLPLLAGLLVVRWLVYWQVGQSVDWVARLRFGLLPVPFRSGYWDYMLLYSIGSFLHALAVAYLWLVLLSMLHPRAVDTPQNRFVREQLGVLDRWPWAVRLLLPGVAVGVAWMLAGPVFEWMHLVPEAKSLGHRGQQALVNGLALYLELRWLLLGLLGVGLLNSYVYLGRATVWSYVQAASQTLLLPLRWLLELPGALLTRISRSEWALLMGQVLALRFGRIDLVPVVAIVAVLLGADQAIRALARIYAQLPF
jgi:hypothetical protein